MALPVLFGTIPGARALAAVALALALQAGCGPARGGAPEAAPVLYVVDGLDATITRLDPASGRVVGAPLPAGPEPSQVVAGEDGRLLVLSRSPDRAHALTFVAPAGRGWAARPVPLEAGARAALLASDGGRYAAVVYSVRDTGPDGPGSGLERCRLALVDLSVGAVQRAHRVCSGTESVVALALETGPAGPAAYLGLWTGPTAVAGRWAAGRGRIAAFHATTGAPLGAYPLSGTPGALLVAPASGRAGPRLYCVETLTGAATGDGITEFPASSGSTAGAAGGWHLVVLDPATLAPERHYPFGDIAAAPVALAVAPDGEHAYALAGAAGDTIVHLDLGTGAASRLVALPRAGLALAVAAERLYVADPRGGVVWIVDRHRGRLLQAVPVGRRPVAMAEGAGAATDIVAHGTHA